MKKITSSDGQDLYWVEKTSKRVVTIFRYQGRLHRRDSISVFSDSLEDIIIELQKVLEEVNNERIKSDYPRE